MATPHPYVPNPRRLTEIINYLRTKGLPTTFSVNTIKKAGIPTSYTGRLINALQFIGVIDKRGKYDSRIKKIFFERSDKEFASDFAKLVETAYPSLFEEHRESAWTLNKEKLTAFFTKTDNKAEVIAEQQARTFLAFASLATARKSALVAEEPSEAEQDSSSEKFVKMFAQFFAENEDALLERRHPFEERDIHPAIGDKCKKMFDDGYYSVATLRACTLLEQNVSWLAVIKKSGARLMNEAFSVNEPKLWLSSFKNEESRKSEQEGYRSLFYGAILAIRNPRAHELAEDNIDQCLDHLSFLSMLMRKLDDSKKV